MGGGQQTNPAQQTWQDYQQQQTYKDLGNTVARGLQGAGASVAGANSGLSGQVAQAPPAGAYGQPQQQAGPSYGATGGLFSQGGGNGMNEQQLAQILSALGYGGGR